MLVPQWVPSPQPTESPTAKTYGYWIGGEYHSYALLSYQNAEVNYFDWDTTYSATGYVPVDEEKLTDDDGGWYGFYFGTAYFYADRAMTYEWGVYFHLEFYTNAPTEYPTTSPTASPTSAPTQDWWGQLGFGSWEDEVWNDYSYSYYESTEEDAAPELEGSWWFDQDDEWQGNVNPSSSAPGANQWWANYVAETQAKYKKQILEDRDGEDDDDKSFTVSYNGTDEVKQRGTVPDPDWWSDEALSPFHNDLESPGFFDSFFFSMYHPYTWAVEDMLGTEMGENWWSAWSFFTPTTSYDDDTSRHNFQFFFYFSHVHTFFEGDAYFFFFFSHVPEQFFTPAFVNPHCAGRRRRSAVSKKQAAGKQLIHVP